MTDIYIVIVEDRHTDVDVVPFTDISPALVCAESAMLSIVAHPENIEWGGLTDQMRDDGWVWLATYGEESDCVRVVRRTLDG